MRSFLRPVTVLLVTASMVVGPALPTGLAVASPPTPRHPETAPAKVAPKASGVEGRKVAAPQVFNAGAYTLTKYADPSYGFSSALAATFDGSHVWTANQGNNTLTETNASDGSLVRVVSGAQYAFNHPWYLVSDGAHIWVTNPDGNSVTEVNIADGSLVRVISGGDYGFHTPRGITYDAATARIWVTNEFGNSLTALKVIDGTFVHVYSGGSYGFSQPNSITDDGTHLWVTNYTGGSVTEVDTVDGSWVRTIGGAPYDLQQPSGATFAHGHVWVSSWSTSAPAVTEISAADGSFTRYIPMPTIRPVGIADFDGYLYVALWEGSSVAQIDEVSGQVVHEFGPADGFNFPQGVVSDGNEVWVVNAGSNALIEIAETFRPPTVLGQQDDGSSGVRQKAVSALISSNGSPTTYHVEWGLAVGTYDHVGPQLPAGTVLDQARAVRVPMVLTDLPILVNVHWRVVATNNFGTHAGVDQDTLWITDYNAVPTLCLTHLQWPLVTADIVGGSGCFHLYQPKAWLGSNKLAIPPPTPYGQTDECLVLVQTCPPPAPVTSPPPLYVSGDNQLITRSTQPTMTAVGNTTGAPVTVLLNGTLITTKSLVVDPGSGIVQGFDATVALSGSADGSVAATPLGQHVHIDVQLPKEYGPPLVGPPPGSGPGLSAGPRVAVAHNAVAHDATPFNCDDPVVKGAPELADLGDPSSVRASLGQLNLGGSDARAYVYDGQVIVCVDIALPVGNCGTTSDFEVKATLLAKQDGLELQDLYAHLDCGMIAGVVFSDLTFSFSNITKAWKAEGTVEAIPGIALRGEVEFAHGAFLRAAISTQPAYLALGFLTLKDVGIEVTPSQTSGHVTFGSIIKVPYTKLDPLSIDAGYTYAFDAHPPYFEANGHVSVFGAQVLDGDVFVYDGPKVHGTAHFGIDLAGLLTAKATVTADYLSSARWNVDGDGEATLLDAVDVGGEVVASDRGVGACVDALGLVHVGLVISSSGSVEPFFDSCDITGARDVLPKVRTIGAPQAGETPTATSNVLSVHVDAGKAVFFGVKGLTGAPAFALVGPKGERRDIPSTGATLDKTVAILHDARSGVTYVGVPHPSAGTWRVVAAPGSQLTELRTGVVRPPAAVSAKVVRHGSSYTLSYKGPKVAGQTVELVERGANGLRLLATVKGGGNGSFAFVPTPGSTAPRELEAMVSQDGLPRTELKAGSYRTPQVKAPTKAPKAKVVRKGTSVVVSWPTLAGADHYLATIRTSDGRARSILTKGLSVSLGKVAATASAVVTVRGMTAGLRGRLVTLRLAGQTLALGKVTFGPLAVGKKVSKATLAFTANRGARVQVSVRAAGAPGNALLTVTKAVRAGKDRYLLPLTVKGKRLRAGTYLVLVIVTAPGLPAVRRSWVVTLR